MRKRELRPILLAEDSEKDEILMVQALKSHHISNKLDVVKNGEEALHYLRCENQYSERLSGIPIVVFLDIKMPKMNGIETLREIRNDPSLRFLPVVMVTSSREEQDLIKSYDLGANSYVTKPVDFKMFSEAIKMVGAYWTLHNEPPPESLFHVND